MKIRINLLLLLLLLAASANARGDLPKLELGASMLALSAPDYMGSSSTSTHFFPVPYIKYRGERLRVDEGAQGIFVDTENLLITLSGNLSLPVDDDTAEREGMDELEAILEFGPSVNYRFKELEDSAWWLDLPLRFAYTLDDELESIGRVFQPRLSWRKPADRLGEWKLRFNFGPIHASDAFHEYFYSVPAANATATRPAFDADGGYSGFRTEFTWSKRFGKYWFGGFLRHDNLHNSKFKDSPLVSDTSSWMGGVALAWVFLQKD